MPETIAIVPLPEVGHLNATLALARAARAEGHRVVYVTIPDMRKAVEDTGFPCHTYFDDVFPLGSRAAIDAGFRAAKSRRALARVAREYHASQNRMNERLLAGGCDELLRGLGASVFVVDFLLPMISLAAHGLGIPSVVFTSTFPTSIDHAVPPNHSDLVPAPGLPSRLRIFAAWQYMAYRLTRKALRERVRAPFVGRVKTAESVAAMAAKAGFPRERISFGTFYGPRLEMDEVVLLPRAFDFPRRDEPRRIYAGLSVNDGRAETPLDWSAVGDRQVVYCALGTRTHRYGDLTRFFRTLLELATARPDLHLVLALGDYARPEELGAVPANATLLRFAPQLDILKRAAVFITAAGAASVQEAIFFGVPLLVVPFDHDQPGNAARVVFHELGQLARLDDGAAALGARVDAVAGAPEVKARLARLREAGIAEAARTRFGLEVIDRARERGTR